MKFMTRTCIRSFYLPVVLCLLQTALFAQVKTLQTDYAMIGIDSKGFITSIKENKTGKEYCPKGISSALMSLYKNNQYILPIKATFNGAKHEIVLTYSNGSVARIKVESKKQYLRFQLLSLKPGNGEECIVWGPYKTTIQEIIGETIGVVRNKEFAIGVQALDINSIEGVPENGDDAGGGYFIDPLPGQTLPDSLKNKIGQRVEVNVNTTGDMPEYVRIYRGSTAVKITEGSELRLFSRNRRMERVITGPPAPHTGATRIIKQNVQPIDVDFIGSAIAFFGCPEPKVLDVIEKIELGENLPHPMYNEEWIKRSARPGEAYLMNDLTPHAEEYAKACGFSHIHAGDIFKTWGHFDLQTKRFPGGAKEIHAITDKYRKKGITLGVHTLTMFTSTNDAYVSPIPTDSLCKAGSTLLVKSISETDKDILIREPDYFRNLDKTHTIKIGKELISYEKVSDQAPWRLLNCVRGQFNTTKSSHTEGETVDKLMNTAYKGFYPDINLQDQYAKRLAQVCNETGIDLMDFDGFGGGSPTGHGTYGDARFIDVWYKNLDKYRLTCGASTSHYFWHIFAFMNWGEPWYSALRESQVNYRMENQRYFERNLMPGMLGWFRVGSDYRPEEIEWIQARSAGFNAGYLLGVDESIEKNGFKNQLFEAVKQWQTARKQNAFTASQKERMKNPKNEFHLVKITANSWDLYPIALHRKFEHKYRAIQTGEPIENNFTVQNSFQDQPMQFYITVTGNINGETVSAINIELNGYQSLELQDAFKAGDKIICDGKSIFLCDANWNKIKQLKADAFPSWKAGENNVVVKSEFSGEQAPSLMFEFKMAGEPERVGK